MKNRCIVLYTGVNGGRETSVLNYTAAILLAKRNQRPLFDVTDTYRFWGVTINTVKHFR